MAEEDMDLEEEQEKDDPVKKKIKLNPDKLRVHFCKKKSVI